MINVEIKIKDGARLPEYQSEGAAGADIYALTHEEVIILQPGETKLIPTGVFMEIPVGYEAQIRPRSGLALNHGLTLLNSPGTIDSDYRGELKVILTNLGQNSFTVTNHMRIAQIVFNRIYRGNFTTQSTLNSTERGEGGFGHTGI